VTDNISAILFLTGPLSMSFLQGLFGAKKERAPAASATESSSAIQKIQEVIGLLEKKSEFLQKKINNEILQAKVPSQTPRLRKKSKYQPQK
jgi:hypothetical protein